MSLLGSRLKIIAVIILLGLGGYVAGYLLMGVAHVATSTVTKVVTVVVEPEQTSIADEYWVKTYSLLQRVKSWVEEVRGLRFPEEVELVAVDREWVVENWGRGFLNITEIGIEEELYKALFIIPEDFNLTERRVSRAGYTMAASAGGKIYVVREYFDPDDEIRAGEILAHELVHILQGDHFDIPSGWRHDEKQAIRAVVEGDAGLVASMYLSEHGGSPSPPIREESLDPLTSIWLFPYIYGEGFVRYVYEERGWSGVNAIYSNMPTSTAEILHPEKYLEGWKPEEVEIGGEVKSEWRLLRRDTLGEYFIKQMLRSRLPLDISGEAAEGWKGDTLEYYGRGDDRIIYWKIKWENEAELEEFLKAFTTLLKNIDAVEKGQGSWVREKYNINIIRENLFLIIIIEFKSMNMG